MAENPFVYGEVVPRAAFVGRDVELSRLSADLADGQKIFLISPRRYGKSSLIAQAFATLGRKRIATLEITVSSFSSYVAFLEGYTRALAALDQSTASRSWLADLFTSFRPEVRAEAGGGVAVSFPSVRSAKDAAKLGAEVFALPARIAARLRRRLVIAMDEFQAVESYEGAGVEEALRAAVQQQRQVGYVFAGSEPSLMEQMVSPRRPFYKAGPGAEARPDRSGRVREVRRESFPQVRPCPRGRHRRGHRRGRAAIFRTTCSASRTKPGTTPPRCRRRRVGLDDVHSTLRRLLAEQEVFFETIWQRLTLAQRAVLRAVVIERGAAILGGDVRIAPSSRRRLQRPDLARRPPAPRRHRPRRRWPVCRGRFADARVGGKEDVLTMI